MVNVLWTGGWDSTFRVAHLVLHYQAEVQPYYIIDPRRRSYPQELETISKIASVLNERAHGEAFVREPEIFNMTDIHVVTSERDSYLKLRQLGPLGEQYVWLRAFQRIYRVRGLELSIHKDDRATMFIAGSVKYVDDPYGGYFELDEEKANPALELFRGMRFPLLRLSKVEMLEISEQLGFRDIMEQTWFCHDPLPGGAPCGGCNPCRDAVREGMAWRLDRSRRVAIARNIRRLQRLLGQAFSWDEQ